MAISNQERVGKALELLKAGLGPFVERELENVHKQQAHAVGVRYAGDERNLEKRRPRDWDAGPLLKVMWEGWNEIFRRTLGSAERNLVSELRDVRNRWAHQDAFSSDDADRALDSMARLLAAISASQADDVNRMKLELRRQVFDAQSRDAHRRASGTLVDTGAAGALKAWRDVVTPHPDVASGKYQQAEFAADLWQVHLGEGSDEYRDPREFFRRTYLTESLGRMLVGAVERLRGKGGDPVVQLQTNFGGGKTHSMLALYHLFGGEDASKLPGIDAVLAAAGVKSVPKARRVVLVGNKISPGNPVTKPDGTVVRTLWGELAYQLGGKKAYARVKADDEHATSPGDMLRELFKEYGPALVLVDEWVAYARQLHDQSDLPAGGFETQFSFAQALTESAKLAGNCLLVISLPASDTAGSPHVNADDVEVGGVRGREALDRLRNVVGRLESSWRPASAEEGFEIVQRRLFQPLTAEAFRQRGVIARAFAELYRNQPGEFPPEARTSDYEKRLEAAFPIHPEIFDRLYTDWSTLIKFQRTRGVLRLMAAVIHSLWEKGDRNPLILPSTIPIDDPRVQFELTRYLPDNWPPIIEKDVDGANSLPLRIDGEVPALGKLSATRRVARTIYMGSAPSSATAHRGIEDRQVKLGCVMPGEATAAFGDALRRLAQAATYLYQDGSRYWYATQPTVTKLAEDRAEQLKRDPDKVADELEHRLRLDVRQMGDFARVYPAPHSPADVADDRELRLVVLPSEHCYSADENNPALAAAKAIWESRGSGPRLYRNTLVFLAADKVRLQDLDSALRLYLAWRSIVDETDKLNLDPHQVRQAESQKRAADGMVTARLPETYQWALVPEQPKPQDAVKWATIRLTGSEPLAVRATRKLKSQELIITSLGATILRKYLDEVPLWRGDHVETRQLVDYFAQFTYLPKVAGPHVVARAMRDGVGLLTWASDSFAFAESFDEGAGRYRGLRTGQNVAVEADGPGLLVRAPVASQQLEKERATEPRPPVATPDRDADPGSTGTTPAQPATSSPARPRRFFGTVKLDATRVGRDASRIAEEVVAHLAAASGAEVSVTLEIEARLDGGASEQLVRTVMENARTLKFSEQAFERE